MRAYFRSADPYITAKLTQLRNDGNARMKLVGVDTWIITTRVDKKGIAQYDNDPQDLKDKLHKRNVQIKRLKAKICDIAGRCEFFKQGYNESEVKEIRDIKKKTGYNLLFVPESKLNNR